MGINQSKYALDQQVHVGGDETIKARVVCISFRVAQLPTYTVLWVDKGEVRYADLPESMLWVV